MPHSAVMITRRTRDCAIRQARATKCPTGRRSDILTSKSHASATRGTSMPNSTSSLNDLMRRLNEEIGKAETDGNKEFFEELLAPAFAMRRADNKTIDDRDQ